MTPIDHSSLAKAIVEEMKAHGHALWIDPEVHSTQHEFIAQMIEERKERMDRRKRIEEKIAGSILLSMILLIITLLGVGAMEWFRKHL
jgi:hypothetical protein